MVASTCCGRRWLRAGSARVESLREHARALIEANLYLTLGTVGADGRPWTSPVYFSPGVDVGDFYWVSAVDARHSRNLSTDPGVSLVVFDSTVAPYRGRAVYAEGQAVELSGAELERAVEFYPRRDGRGAGEVGVEDLVGEYRMYRVTATALWVLCPREPRQSCAMHGRSDDHRASVFGGGDGSAEESHLQNRR